MLRMHKDMTLTPRLLLATLSFSLLFGCSTEESAWFSGDEELTTGSSAITVEVATAVRSAAMDELLPSPLLGPERVAVFVGDELYLDLNLVDPSTLTLIAGQLPSSALFSSDPTGGEVSWTPALSDVGDHEFILHAVLTDSPDQVSSVATIDVTVVPRFGLIEYGF
jgi:hypothetical protein